MLLLLALAGPAGDLKNALLRRCLGCHVADCVSVSDLRREREKNPSPSSPPSPFPLPLLWPLPVPPCFRLRLRLRLCQESNPRLRLNVRPP